jgi:PAS domain S-box-containing protein
MVLDDEDRIRFINHTIPDMRVEQVIGKPVYEFVDRQFHAEMRACYEGVRATGEVGRYQVQYVDQQGAQHWFASQVTAFQEDGRTVGLTVHARDVTDFRQIQFELDRQKGILLAVIDSMADGVAVVNERGEFLFYNRAAEQLVGIKPQDVAPEDWSAHFGLYRSDRVTPFPVDELPLIRAASGQKQHEVEVYVKNPNKPSGTVLSVNASPLVDQQRQHHGGVAVFRDITMQKQQEEQLKSEERLLRRLLDLHESERKVYAHEIHDGFVQYVVGANMRLEAARARLTDECQAIAEPLAQASALLRKAIAEARRMISDLRPMVMDEKGVVEAIRHLIADQKAQFGIDVRFPMPEKLPELDPRLEGAILRIIQEALNNVIHHADTDDAVVELRHDATSVHLTIHDQGVGFDPSRVPAERFGLRSICERARLFGGHAEIKSQPGGGTTVRVELPLAPVANS